MSQAERWEEGLALESMSPKPGIGFCALEQVTSEAGLLLGCGHTLNIIIQSL